MNNEVMIKTAFILAGLLMGGCSRELTYEQQIARQPREWSVITDEVGASASNNALLNRLMEITDVTNRTRLVVMLCNRLAPSPEEVICTWNVYDWKSPCRFNRQCTFWNKCIECLKQDGAELRTDYLVFLKKLIRLTEKEWNRMRTDSTLQKNAEIRYRAWRKKKMDEHVHDCSLVTKEDFIPEDIRKRYEIGEAAQREYMNYFKYVLGVNDDGSLIPKDEKSNRQAASANQQKQTEIKSINELVISWRIGCWKSHEQLLRQFSETSTCAEKLIESGKVSDVFSGWNMRVSWMDNLERLINQTAKAWNHGFIDPDCLLEAMRKSEIQRENDGCSTKLDPGKMKVDAAIRAEIEWFEKKFPASSGKLKSKSVKDFLDDGYVVKREIADIVTRLYESYFSREFDLRRTYEKLSGEDRRRFVKFIKENFFHRDGMKYVARTKLPKEFQEEATR